MPNGGTLWPSANTEDRGAFIYGSGMRPRCSRPANAGQSPRLMAVPRVYVDVVLKPEILDPQGQAIAGALRRLGIEGISDVRQGKHFELTVEDGMQDAAIQATVTRLADTLLANPVIETFTVRRG